MKQPELPTENSERQLHLACECGEVRGTVSDISPQTGTHLICLCRDCQAFATFLVRNETLLDANGGTAIYQLTPSQLDIHAGSEQIACMQLSASGMLRWYSACCKSPIANTLQSPSIPFAGLHVSLLVKDDPNIGCLGSINDRIYGSDGYGEMPNGTHAKVPVRLVLRSVRRLLSGMIRRRHRPSPFFVEAGGGPIATPRVLTAAERLHLNQESHDVHTR